MARADRGYDALRAELNKGVLHPVYILTGEEDLLRDEATDLIVAKALEGMERGFDLDVFRGGETTDGEIVACASAFPMGASRRVVVVRETEKLRPADRLAAYVQNPLPTTCLVLSAGKADFRKKPFAGGADAAFVVSFPPLSEEHLPEWIRTRIESQGRRITPRAAALLAARTGTILREVQSEIEKLFLYAGDRQEIDENDVAGLAGFTREFSITELQIAIGGRNPARAVSVLERMLETGESGPGIVFMLSRFFANLWKVRDLQQREPRASSYDRRMKARVWKEEWGPVEAAAGSFSLAELESAFPVLTAADEALKSTGTDPRAVLLSMVVRLANPSSQHRAP